MFYPVFSIEVQFFELKLHTTSFCDQMVNLEHAKQVQLR